MKSAFTTAAAVITIFATAKALPQAPTVTNSIASATNAIPSFLSPPIVESLTSTPPSATVTGNEPFCITVTVAPGGTGATTTPTTTTVPGGTTTPIFGGDTTTSTPSDPVPSSDLTGIVTTVVADTSFADVTRRQAPTTSSLVTEPVITTTTDSVTPITTSSATSEDVTGTPPACTVTVTLDSSSTFATVTSPPVTLTSSVNAPTSNAPTSSANPTGAGGNSASSIGISIGGTMMTLLAGIGAILL
ncbi:hypothetical protein DXG01_003280 [Tephrocybe rancida]|nr:hypothetical protein DXG01_003280 [Tephrocybe rancida]